jgi:diadenylate cyclase
MTFEWLSPTTLRGVCDVLIVAYLVYRGLLVIKGTRAAPMLAGLTFLTLLYFFAKPLGLVTLAWILENFLSSLLLVVVILFQDEIRRGLTKVGAHQLYRKEHRKVVEKVLEDVALVASRLSEARLGALIVITRDVGLDEFLDDGVVLNAQFHRKVLFPLFLKESPLHDGAVIIEGGIIRAAGCVLPLSFNPDLDPSLGTRHRAALGLSERSDAVIIVVSEENGSISVVRDGNMVRNLDGSHLRDLLIRLIAHHDLSEDDGSENSEKGAP